MGTVFTTEITGPGDRLAGLLDASGLAADLVEKKARTILIKPNLVEALNPPITTPVSLIRSLVEYIRAHFSGEIIIGEGTGALQYDTFHCFDKLGYTELAAREQIELVDLNEEKSVRLTDPNCQRWPEMYLPELAFESYLISVPVLKVHTLAVVTLTLKNMMGLVPPAHYRKGNSWKKSAFHNRVQEAVADLNRYRTPDFTLLDASVGMAQAHLWGPTCDPPVGKLVAGFDPVAIDAYGAELLGSNWRNIGHIASLHNQLGSAEPLDIIEVK